MAVTGQTGDARAAVDALIGVDVELRFGFKSGFVFSGMNAVYRANVHACGVLGSDARLGDYISHRAFSWDER